MMLNALMAIPEIGPAQMGSAAGLHFSVGEVGGSLGPTLLGLLTDLSGSFTLSLMVLAAFTAVMTIRALHLS